MNHSMRVMEEKEHKKYELENKSGVAKTSSSLTMSAIVLKESPYDGHALGAHLNSDHRMIRNYLRGTRGKAINTMMAVAAYNMRHWMNKIASSFVSSFVSRLQTLVGRLENVIFGNEKLTASQSPTLATVT